MAARSLYLFAAILAAMAVAACSLKPRPHNLVIFVADGLRSGIVTQETAPAMAELRRDGVDFQNSHALFPTVTTANASAIATGHGLGDTGDFGNNLWVGEPSLKASLPSHIAVLEDNQVLLDMNRRFGGNYLGETTLLEAARKAGFQTAVVGKFGPAAIQASPALDGASTIIIDDATGVRDVGLPLDKDVKAAIKAAGLDTVAQDRGLNGDPGTFEAGGVFHANDQQQDWFVDVVTKVLLPRFKAADKPFVLVFWSRDPDGTQHNAGDSLNKLTPGINGKVSLMGVKNADNDLARIRKALKDQGLDDTTDIVVTADHGFSTDSRQSVTSASARRSYPDVVPSFLPPGFAALDLAKALGLPAWDPYGLDFGVTNHPKGGSALLGKDFLHPYVTIAASGGADLMWLKDPKDKALAIRIVDALIPEDYTSAIFVDDALGPIPGTLPLSAIGLVGSARTPRPQIIVSFRSYSTGCAQPELCTAEVSETELQQGQGQHGSFSRANTHNFMAAIGPDFKAGFVDPAPVSNADWAPTLAKLLGLDLGGAGSLKGRVMAEALKDGGAAPAFTRQTTSSTPARGGFTTVLEWQSLGAYRYYDSAGAPGRVVR
jgi:arylsulfatase A-like enzyme